MDRARIRIGRLHKALWLVRDIATAAAGPENTRRATYIHSCLHILYQNIGT